MKHAAGAVGRHIRHQTQTRRTHRALRFMGPLQLMQGLAGATHQGLALGLRQLGVLPVLRSELLKQLQLVGRKPGRGLTQTAA